MESLATILVQHRRRRHLGLNRAAESLAIPEHYLRAIESGDFQKIPAGYRQLYIRDYARWLGLNGDHALALFRRDFRGGKTERFFLKEHFFSSWSKLLANWQALFLVGFVLLLVIYLGFEYYRFQRPPAVNLNYLPAITSNQTLIIKGRAYRTVVLRFNGQPLLLDEKGHFQKKVMLVKGDNWLSIEAVSPAGKKIRLRKKIVFRP